MLPMRLPNRSSSHGLTWIAVVNLALLFSTERRSYKVSGTVDEGKG